jgi:hypothetical protein
MDNWFFNIFVVPEESHKIILFFAKQKKGVLGTFYFRLLDGSEWKYKKNDYLV